MDLRVSYGLINTLYASGGSKPQPKADSAQKQAAIATAVPATLNSPTEEQNTSQTRLIDQKQEETDSGIRRTSTFEQADGRTFTRVEELSLSQTGARRAVIQQNPSGNITRYEEVLDRQPGGNFRRTQRFQDESGDVATQITPDYQVKDAFILTGGSVASFSPQTPFTPMRGTQLDLHA